MLGLRRLCQSPAYQNVPARTDKPPVGWATWYTFYEHIDEEIILGNLVLKNSPAIQTWP